MSIERGKTGKQFAHPSRQRLPDRIGSHSLLPCAPLMPCDPSGAIRPGSLPWATQLVVDPKPLQTNDKLAGWELEGMEVCGPCVVTPGIGCEASFGTPLVSPSPGDVEFLSADMRFQVY